MVRGSPTSDLHFRLEGVCRHLTAVFHLRASQQRYILYLLTVAFTRVIVAYRLQMISESLLQGTKGGHDRRWNCFEFK